MRPISIVTDSVIKSLFPCEAWEAKWALGPIHYDNFHFDDRKFINGFINITYVPNVQ
jgi:hypothetical protein